MLFGQDFDLYEGRITEGRLAAVLLRLSCSLVFWDCTTKKPDGFVRQAVYFCFVFCNSYSLVSEWAFTAICIRKLVTKFPIS